MNRVRLHIFYLLPGLILAVTGCREDRKPASDVLARVGSVEIRAADLIAESERRHRPMRNSADRQVLLEELITRQALLARALDLHLDQDAKVRRSYENLLIGELKARDLDPKLRATEVTLEDLKAAPGSSSAPAVQAPVSEFAVLSMSAHAKPSPEKRAQMVARLAEARQKALHLPIQTKDFGELAGDYSDDQVTRYRGGQAGWFQQVPGKYRFPAQVIEAGFRLRYPGDISDVIETANGVYLVRLMDRRNAGEPGPAPDEALTRQRVLAQKQAQTEAQFIQAARSAVSISVYPDHLQRVPL